MKKILVVDDEADTRVLIRRLLEREGYQVSTAKDGNECLGRMKKEKFDLVVIDFFMKMTGRKLAEKIRKDPKLKDAKLAFLTIAQFRAKGMEYLKNLGILDYIKKPIVNEDFVKRIKKLVS